MSKRHPSLIPVARDHVHALSIAVRLQRGRKGESDRWPQEPADQLAALRAFYADHLQRHFEIEEDLVFPIAKRHVPESTALVSRLLEEHRQLERMIVSPEAATLDAAALAAIGTLLEAHVRREDRTLFPLMEAHVPEAILSALRVDVDARYA